jgi:hypothetical protein
VRQLSGVEATTEVEGFTEDDDAPIDLD